MKRYTCTSYPDDVEPSIDGPYVLFTDAQADKHAALKELAAKTMTFGLWHYPRCGINSFVPGETAFTNTGDESKCNCGLREFLAHLKSLTEPTP